MRIVAPQLAGASWAIETSCHRRYRASGTLDADRTACTVVVKIPPDGMSDVLRTRGSVTGMK